MNNLEFDGAALVEFLITKIRAWEDERNKMFLYDEVIIFKFIFELILAVLGTRNFFTVTIECQILKLEQGIKIRAELALPQKL